jgi:two-component system, NarL family, nitrate/nitrite response regulator NarL
VIVVFVVAEVALHREGLAALLADEQDLRVVGLADGSDDALLDAVDADVFVVDVASESDLGTVRQLVARGKERKVVAVGVPESEKAVLAMVEAGVSGFVLANEGIPALVDALHGAVRGEIRCSPRMTAMLAHRVATLAAMQQRVPVGANLTARELEIVALIDERLSNKEIAHVLQIEVSTVKNHVHNILDKLQVSRRADAAARVRSAFRERRIDRIEVLAAQAREQRVDPRIQRDRFGG